jgi:hypothetical protein
LPLPTYASADLLSFLTGLPCGPSQLTGVWGPEGSGGPSSSLGGGEQREGRRGGGRDRGGWGRGAGALACRPGWGRRMVGGLRVGGGRVTCA